MPTDQNLLDEFIVESKEHLANIERDFLALEKQEGNDNKSIIDKIFRSIHSIKGSSGFLNLKIITKLSHSMEALLQKSRDDKILIQSEHIDTLLEGVDLLSQLLENPLENDIDINDIINRLKDLSKEKQQIETPKNENNISKKNINKNNTSKNNTSKNNIKNISEKNIINDEQSNTQKELNQSQTIEIDQLKNFGFNKKYLLKNNENLFIVNIDIFSIEKEKRISPVSLIYDFESMGKLLDCQLNLSAKNFSEFMSHSNIHLKFLYETPLSSSEISLMLFVPEEQIIIVNKKESETSENLSDTCTTNDNIYDSETNINQNFSPQIIEEIPDLFEEPINFTDQFEETVRNHVNFEETVSTTDQFEKTDYIDSQVDKTSENQVSKSSDTPQIQEKNTKNKNIPKNKLPGKTQQKHKSETIRINIRILDKIMNLAGELVLVRNQQLLEVDKKNPRQVDISQRLDIVTSELQEAIMRTRMQPVGNLFSRLPRIIRDLEKKMKKSILFLTNGNEVELDKNILESLTDPLFHIIRNACDHGIEIPKERLASGKSETGYVKIDAYHEAGQINIKIEDDGKGIDIEKVKEKALKNDLKSKKELSRMNEKDLLNLIMLPGFTTKDQTTEISGRGVGMDVVKEAVEQMSGSIDIYAEKGKGSIIHLRLPLTLAIIPSLIVIVENERFAIPEVNVEEIVSLFDSEIYTMIEIDGDQEVFRLRNDLLPLVRLNEILQKKEAFTESTRFEISKKYNNLTKKVFEKKENIREVLIFAVLKMGDQRFGLIVNEIIGTEEIVVNPLHSIVKPLKIYSGTTIMGDGTVALILDVNGISEHTGIKFSTQTDTKFKKGEIEENDSDTHRVLLFKSGNKEQFAIPLILLRRVEIISSKSIQEIGDKEYISLNGQTTLIIRLDSILNVSQILEKRKKMFLLLPKQANIPMGILISSIIDVVNMPLTINKQDYIEEGFLGSSLVNEKITLFLDLFRIVEKITNQIDSRDSSSSIKQIDHSQYKILLAEDTVFFRRLIKGQLQTAGFNVTTAENGRLALDMLENKSFDLIVSDIEMPEMDGLTLIKSIRKNDKLKHIPAISVTSLDSPEDRVAGKAAGFNAYHLKADKKNLIKTIDNLLMNTNNKKI